MDKLKMRSPDLTQQNIDRIAELFPTVVTESRDDDGNPVRAVNFDLLHQELSDHIVEGPQERYQLDWPGKREALFAANAPIAKTLRPVREESVDFDTTKNLFIEGDNLDVLKLLQESYLGKVKLIYIDPPYNTGNDFVYADDFSDSTTEYLVKSGQTDDKGARLVANAESNGRFHSDWLSMMYPRLKLARNVLNDDGAIVVSIDDNEVHNLRSVMDEVFGRSSFVACIAWQKRYSRENRGAIGDAHEYLLVYARNPDRFQQTRGLIPPTEKQTAVYKNPNDDPKGRWRPVPMTAQGYRPNQMYEIVTPSGACHTPPDGRCWGMTEPAFLALREEGRIYFGKNGDSQPSVIRYLDEVEGFVPWTWWPAEEVGHTDEARKEIRRLFGTQTVFDTPKPVRLMRRILDIVVPSDGIVLDFFAGSATLAHAVIEANAADSRRRQFVMVQMAETLSSEDHAFTSVTEVAKERIRRASAEIVAAEHHAEWDGDVGFRVLRLDTTNFADTLRTADGLEQERLGFHADNVKPGRTDEDLLFQVLLDWGLELTMPIAIELIDGHEVFVVEDGLLIADFDLEIPPSLVREIAERQPLRAVFRDRGFTTDADRINAEQVFVEVSAHTDVKVI